MEGDVLRFIAVLSPWTIPNEEVRVAAKRFAEGHYTVDQLVSNLVGREVIASNQTNFFKALVSDPASLAYFCDNCCLRRA
jgi:hypothetical protein